MAQLRSGSTVGGHTIWHAGNHGAGSGLDADLLDGQQGSYYLDYNNFSNKPSIAYTSVIAADDFTQTEVNNLRAGKLDNGSTPWTSNNYYDDSDALNVIGGAVNDSGTADTDLWSAYKINNELSEKSNTGHTHDGRYYTESEIDTKLAGKSNTGHTHNYDNYGSWTLNAGSATGIGSGGVVTIQGGGDVSVSQSGGTVTISCTDTNTNTWRPVDDSPSNGVTGESISSNWAYDHANNASAHHTKYTDGDARGAIKSSLDYVGFENNEADTYSLSDGRLLFDSSMGLLIGRTQQDGFQSGDTYYAVLDAANVGAGTGINISGGKGKDSTPVTFSVDTGTIATRSWVSSNYNNYSHPSDGGNSVSNLSGDDVVSGIAVNSAGHVTGISTRSLTPANIGAATSGHNHTYNVNNSWLRDNGDNANVKLYGNSRQMAFRTDGTTEYSTGVGGYPFVWMYGGNASGDRLMLLKTSGDLWTSANGWLSAALGDKSGTGHTHDGRYYTETEVDNLLSGKSNTGHTHNYMGFHQIAADYLLESDGQGYMRSSGKKISDFASASHSHSYDNYGSWTLSAGSTLGVGSGDVVTIQGGGDVSVSQSNSTGSTTVTISCNDTNTWRGIDDSPVNGVTTQSISSNWAYDHQNSASAHHSRYTDSEAQSAAKSTTGWGEIDFSNTTGTKLDLYGGTYKIGIGSGRIEYHSNGGSVAAHRFYQGGSQIVDFTDGGDIKADGWKEFSDGYISLTMGANIPLSTSWVELPWDTAKRNDAAFTWDSSAGTRIYVNASGDYKITVDVTSYQYSTTTRTQSRFRILKNGSTLTGGYGWMYNREVTEGYNTASATLIVSCAANDYITVEAEVYSGSTNVNVSGAGTRFYMEKI